MTFRATANAIVHAGARRRCSPTSTRRPATSTPSAWRPRSPPGRRRSSPCTRGPALPDGRARGAGRRARAGADRGRGARGGRPPSGSGGSGRSATPRASASTRPRTLATGEGGMVTTATPSWRRASAGSASTAWTERRLAARSRCTASATRGGGARVQGQHDRRPGRAGDPPARASSTASWRAGARSGTAMTPAWPALPVETPARRGAGDRARAAALLGSGASDGPGPGTACSTP